VESAPAFALSVLFLAIAIVGNLPGGVLYLFSGSQRRGAETPRKSSVTSSTRD
jgi:hypothetical protein